MNGIRILGILNLYNGCELTILAKSQPRSSNMRTRRQALDAVASSFSSRNVPKRENTGAAMLPAIIRATCTVKECKVSVGQTYHSL